MIKKLSEQMRHFSIGTPKENYSFDEVQRYLEDQKKGLVSYFDKEVTAELDKLASDKTSLTSKNEALEASVKSLTEEKTTLESSVETLQGELKPFKEQSTKAKATELLKGKVVEGAELDAFKLLDLKEFDKVEEDKKEAFINEAVNKLVEEKTYLKPVESKPGGEKEEFFEEEKHKKQEKYKKPSPRRF